MKVKRQIGIWMDHSNAHLIEFSTDSVKTKKTIDSKFTHEEQSQSLSKSENLMHNKRQQLQAAYYKTLGETIKKYDEVVLFGPTDAKTELLNTLNDDHHFDGIRIAIKQSDSMTENQEHAFVREFFTNP